MFSTCTRTRRGTTSMIDGAAASSRPSGCDEETIGDAVHAEATPLPSPPEARAGFVARACAKERPRSSVLDPYGRSRARA